MYDVTEVGAFAPNPTPKEKHQAGEVGYIAASIKSIQDVAVGDTVTLATNPAPAPLPGYKKVQPVVFCGIYPLDGSKFNDLKEAILKLQLNDASLIFEPDNSIALGFGFLMGKIGILYLPHRVVVRIKLNEIVYVKYLAQCLAYCGYSIKGNSS